MSRLLRPLRVLMTNTALVNRAGSELYIRDVALELRRRGHRPLIYSPRLGEVAQEIRRSAIPVVDDLSMIGAAPDLIHGQHHLETMTALAHFPGVPAVYTCHGWLPWEETPPLHPRILGYVAVSEAVRDRVVYESGVAPDRVWMIGNFVDTAKFQPRDPLPLSPRRALLFDNHAHDTNYAQSIRQACAEVGLSLDVVGLYNGNPVSHPEELLRSYDVIFSRGRAAFESLGVGAAVIICGQEGAGPMVSRANLGHLMLHNFGIQVMDQRITVEWAVRQLRAYDASDANAVSQTIRAGNSLEGAVDRIGELYSLTMEEWDRGAAGRANSDAQGKEDKAVASYMKWLSVSLSVRVHETVQLQAALSRLGTESVLVQSASDHLKSEHDRLKTEHHHLTNESAQLRAELAAVAGSLTFRVYQRFVRMPLIRKAWRTLANPFKRRRERHEAGGPATSSSETSSDPAPDTGFDIGSLPSIRHSGGGAELACVVLSVGNPSSLIAAVRSLLAEGEPIEVVVVNSGGGDPAASLDAAGIQARVINRQQLLYPGGARNEGILASRAPYVAFLASDCIAEAGWVTSRLKRHRAGGLVVSSAVTNAAPRNLWSWVAHVALFSRRMPGLAQEEAVHYGMSYDRRLFDRFGLFREDLRAGEDSEFNERLRDVPVQWAPEVRSAHRHPTRPGSLLADQHARGRRMAHGMRRLTGRGWNGVVARNAVTRIPTLVRLGWRGSRGKERLYVAAAAPLLVPAAVSYALGALRTGPPAVDLQPGPARHRILALLTFHNESAYLSGYLENVASQVDGIVALDDGSTDGSAALLSGHEAVLETIRLPERTPHVWDEPRNRRLLIEAALRHGAEWIVVVDADERLETGFRERAEAEIARAQSEGHLAYRVTLRELWDSADRYRADGIWGGKYPPRFFRARADHHFDDRAFHGFWTPLNSQRDGDYPKADLILYHLRMIAAADRLARQQRYQSLDPYREFQEIGYDYMTDESGLVLETLPEGRHYELVEPRQG